VAHSHQDDQGDSSDSNVDGSTNDSQRGDASDDQFERD